MFSVAVPARWWTKENPFDYTEIAQLADRVIVMAYDEHWRTGPAGPIASLPWCTKVLNFAKTYIPKEKLVMGLPLYGRAWQVDAVPEALKYFQTTALCKKNQCVVKMTEAGTPYFEFNGTFTIAVHFEDMQSLTEKVKTYHTNDIAALSFWRIGQEPAEFWNTVQCLTKKR
ncbi:MAG TPA: glycosyl hydrolase family 18 protein, partial [Candidatus Bathyarchaeia archaeon]|nr:glycosyl hydrolase family 18 protein [Candidatus Bathyarchaeia archaeon]